MAQRISLPASTLRRVVSQTYGKQAREQSKGRTNNARRIAEARDNIHKAIGEKNAHFVGVKASDVSTVSAFNEASRHDKDVIADALRRTGYWRK